MTADYNGWADSPEEEREEMDLENVREDALARDLEVVAVQGRWFLLPTSTFGRYVDGVA